MSKVAAISIHTILLSVELSALLSLKLILILYARCLIRGERLLLRKPRRLIIRGLNLVRISVTVLARVNEIAEPVLSYIRALLVTRLTLFEFILNLRRYKLRRWQGSGRELYACLY